MTTRLTVAAALMLAGPPTAALAANVVVARGHWAAIEFGSRCEARSKAVHGSAKRPAGIVGLAFGHAALANGRFYARLSRVPRDGTTVVATIGGQPFLLTSSGEWAWARNRGQDSAIANAVRFNGGMRISSRDRSGRRFSDRYLLDGAATAIDAAAARCAKAGK